MILVRGPGGGEDDAGVGEQVRGDPNARNLPHFRTDVCEARPLCPLDLCWLRCKRWFETAWEGTQFERESDESKGG